MIRDLVLFVCTGNQCRSPMAEYLFRHHFAKAHLRVGSAGVMCGDGVPASKNAVKALKELGIDLRPHRSRRLSRELIDAALVVVVMTEGHRWQVLERFPDAESRVYLLTQFESGGSDGDVEDPVGMSLDVYRQTRDAIASALWGLDRFLMRRQAEQEQDDGM